jgi:NADP-dependent 3-hydroxy acid dehydrogenase YdfG
VVALAGDLNDKPFVRQLAQTAHDADVFVNNAGILNYAPILDMPVEECEQMFATNVIACYDISREVAQHMVASGGGQMIFVTSGSARSVGMHAVVYAATKHAVSAFAKGFRLELKSANVRVTELAPGMVDTDMTMKQTGDGTRPAAWLAPVLASTVMLTPEDIAVAVIALIEDDTAAGQAKIVGNVGRDYK